MIEIKRTLKPNTVLLITTQEELNLFAELEDGVSKDALCIDEPYIAFTDGDNAIQLLPQSDIDDSYPIEFHKPRKFSSWYRSNAVRKSIKDRENA